MARNLIADVDLSAIRHNYCLARAQAAHAHAVAIIKADAYGHGAVRVARALETEADAFGVAAIEEALELREGGITRPILLLEGFFEAEELELICQHQLWTAMHSLEQLALLERFLQQRTDVSGLHVWLKIDSGMHRLGVHPDDVQSALERLQALTAVESVVAMSHFACADEPQRPDTLRQLQQIDRSLSGMNIARSLCNSAGVMHWPQAHHQWLRPGIMLYGASPFAEPQPVAAQLKPGMTLSTEIIAIREVPAGDAVGYGASWIAEVPTRIATLAVGYADGYSRHAPSGTPVWLNGRRAALAGRVSMDMATVDLSLHPEARVGDRVELWGANIPVNEVADYCGTIPYTLLSGLTRRVKRRYTSE
ncbi:Alanine racemase [Nitrincola lacisaponensis]|uniref:Alanine racemase n=1 Tax=Nitrincola lacisaponensis TaxID=267850 RepID=A0A063XZP3_9GAMM|nr:alanine racemase [Nitrincola lacisaponensis]KDE38924.1 Alanine racemase [Nitrincola lacisaponensis]